MFRLYNRIIRSLLVILLAVFLVTQGRFTVHAEDGEVLFSGLQGSVNWRIEDDGTLYFSSGNFSNMTNQNTTRPWFDHRSIITRIVFEGNVNAGTNLSFFLNGLNQVTEIEQMENFNTGNTTDMTNAFSQMSSITTIDLTHLNTTNVVFMTSMFADSPAITTLDFSNFNTPNLDDATGMFTNNTGIISLDLSTFNTSNASSLNSLFSGMSNLEYLNISSFSTNEYLNISGMFIGTTNLKQIVLGNSFDVTESFGDPSFQTIPTSANYSGKWQNVDTGTTTAPNGTYVLTPLQLSTAYLGGSMADTYVWQPAPDTTLPILTAVLYTATGYTGTSTPTNWTTVFSVSATDNIDGNLTSVIAYSIDPTTIDMNVVGIHTINASVSDTAGNIATLVLEYHVEDHEDPIISSTQTTVTVNTRTPNPTSWASVFGLSAIDSVDGNLTSVITFDVDPSTIDMAVIGSYTITATVEDLSGNTDTLVLTYVVEDKTNPNLSANQTTISVNTGTSNPTSWTSLYGVSASDNIDGNLTSAITYSIDPLSINMNIVGSYTITATVEDNAGNSTNLSLVFNVEDRVAPLLNAARNIVNTYATTSAPTSWFEIFGVDAFDNIDGNLTNKITFNILPSSIDMNVVTSHTIIATVTDNAGNTSTITFTYNVIDHGKPIINAQQTSITVKTGSAKPSNWTTLFGLQVSDLVDGDLTSQIVYSLDPATLDMTIAKTYTITATVRDHINNTTTITLIFVVEDSNLPVDPTDNNPVDPTDNNPVDPTDNNPVDPTDNIPNLGVDNNNTLIYSSILITLGLGLLFVGKKRKN